eukprot:365802-Chlamydomonas_euryale.AAC.12
MPKSITCRTTCGSVGAGTHVWECWGMDTGVEVLGHGHRCGSVGAWTQVWECWGRDTGVEVMGQGHTCGSVGAWIQVWKCWGRDVSVGVLGQGHRWGGCDQAVKGASTLSLGIWRLAPAPRVSSHLPHARPLLELRLDLRREHAEHGLRHNGRAGCKRLCQLSARCAQRLGVLLRSNHRDSQDASSACLHGRSDVSVGKCEGARRCENTCTHGGVKG